MAQFPQGLSAIDARCNAGERRVLHQLKRCLEDDYLVWHDIPIGPRARQPDFVILSPRWGVLLLEVKDWRRSSIVAGTRDAIELKTERGRATVAHPLRQARDVVLELADLMKTDPALVHASGPFAGRLLFPHGHGVVMSTLRASDVTGSDFAALFEPHRTLLRDDLEPTVGPLAFQQRLWGMFTVSYPHTLTLPQRDRIRWHLFPEVRLAQQASLFGEADDAAPPLPALMQVMDLQQEQVARTLGEGHRVIHGAAGSGKTMILIFRAQVLANTARPERPILVMCFNRTLAGRIEAQLRQRGVDERVQVRTFHAWCQDMVNSYQLEVPRAATKARRDNAWFEALAGVLERAVESGRVPGGQYHALLIDEAHDFEDAWLRLATRMVAPDTNSLLVLYDDAQSIYHTARRKRLNFASVGIEARGRTSVLRLNYRNTAEVLALAMQCAQQLLQGDGSELDDNTPPLVMPASAGRRGPLPVLMRGAHALEEAEWVVQRLREAQASGIDWNDIAVLAPTRALLAPFAAQLRRAHVPHQSMGEEGFRRFNWRERGVKLLTMHSAKGLEFPWVAVAGLQALPLRGEPIEEALRLVYVAMTRATQQLVLSAHGEPTPIVVRVQQALREVAARFAAG
jgi:Nuclease-related domain/AAA domain/UvrD-like helicase C-terminal domain